MLASCAGSKKVAYFQNAVDGVVKRSEGLYDAKIMPKDILTITVSTTNPEAATPFNLTISNTLNATGQMYSGSGVLQTYLVDNNGEIEYPVVGNIKVAGLTKNECQELVKSKIKAFFLSFFWLAIFYFLFFELPNSLRLYSLYLRFFRLLLYPICLYFL